MSDEIKDNPNIYETKGKYHYWISDEGLTLVTGWARDGLSNKQIAHNIGIQEGTFYEWQKRHSEFSKAVKKGKEVIDREVENALYNKAIEGDTTSMIFWLKNRRPEQWSDRKEITHGGSVDSNVKMFEKVSTDELRDIVSDVKDILRGDNE